MIEERLIFRIPIETPAFICTDANALAFIAAHELATGSTMGAIQQQAVCILVGMLKGTGTTNGTDFWTSMVADGTAFYPLVPIDDTTANATAYSMDLVTATALGTYNNFVSGDFQPTGVTGGTTKYFDTGKAPLDYLSDDNCFGVYCMDAFGENTASIGARQGGALNSSSLNSRSMSDTKNFINNRNGSSNTIVNSDGAGLFYCSRDSSGFESVIQDTTIDTLAATRSARSSYNYYAHALNSVGSAIAPATKELSMYFVGMRPIETAARITDFYEAVNTFQTNVITGGRNV